MTAQEIDNFNDLLTQAEMNARGNWECDFTASVRARFKRWEGETFVSPKQLEQLEKLCAKG